MRCESRSVPSVAATSACVSPRVNSAEPWARGSTPFLISIWRTVRVSRPSMRGSPPRIWPRTMRASMSNSRLSTFTSSTVDAVGLQRGLGLRIGLPGGLRAGLLRADLVGLAQRALGQLVDAGDEGLVLGRRLPVPGRLAGVAHQLVDGGDGDVALLMAEHHAAEHDLLGQLLGLALDHQHGGFGAGDDEVELRVEQLGLARIEHVLAVDVADARGADRAVERNAADGERGARADQRGDVGRDLGVERHHVDDHLHLVVEAFGKERPQRPVDQPRGQRLELARAAFALEEAAGDLAGGIGLLDVVDGQREEVLAGLGFLARRRRWRARRCRRC